MGVGPEATSAHSFKPPDWSADTPPALYKFNEPQFVPAVHRPVAIEVGFLQVFMAAPQVDVVKLVSLTTQDAQENCTITSEEKVHPTNPSRHKMVREGIWGIGTRAFG